MKLNKEEKIRLYEERKAGKTISSLAKRYGILSNNISYLVRLIDRHGYKILRENKNRYYSQEFKEEIINRVLINHESMGGVAIEVGLSSVGILANWIRKYKENSYNVLEKKRGRPSMTKKTKVNENTEVNELEKLRKENEYLKAENEYLKKLRAVVQARQDRQPKKK